MRALRLILALVFALLLHAEPPLTPLLAENLEEGEEAVHLVRRGSLRRPVRAREPSRLARVSERAAHQESARRPLDRARSSRRAHTPAGEVRKLPSPRSESVASPEDH